MCPFPKLLDPVDDLPPATVITRVVRDGQKLIVRGTAIDNTGVKGVQVNGVAAKSLSRDFAEWEAVLENSRRSRRIEAQSEDIAGNVERTPMVLVVR